MNQKKQNPRLVQNIAAFTEQEYQNSGCAKTCAQKEPGCKNDLIICLDFTK